MAVAPSVRSQAGFSSTVQSFRHAPFGNGEQMFGRDFWFAPIHQSADPSSYFALYVASPDSGTVHVQLGNTGPSLSTRVIAHRDTTLLLPAAWILGSSGVVEAKGIHVWSLDADLTCHFLSNVGYSADGTYLIPTLGLGTEYVVAAYAALFMGSGNGAVDYPSEFSVVATQDNTTVTITPTSDIRMEKSSGACCSCVYAPQGQPIQVVMNRGDAIQCKTTCASDCDNYDLTGTVIRSTQPVGVIGGSDCPNIPCDFAYCDHVCHMLPTVDSWGKTYYSVPFFQSAGQPPQHNASTFLVIATKPGQVIRRQNQVYFSSSKAFDFYWRSDVDQSSTWSSDQPFLLVQYHNSASYPDNVDGSGDPSEVVLTPKEEYMKSILFQAPVTIGKNGSFVNYANIIAHSGDQNVLLDGSNAKKYTQIYIDGICVGYRATVSPGAHSVTSDSGVTVYCYGYGTYESYAWSGALGVVSQITSDSIPPLASVSPLTCQIVRITVVDSGQNASKLQGYKIDSAVNLQLNPDVPTTNGDSIALYDATVLDPASPGLLRARFYDLAGNWTTVTLGYAPTTSARVGPLQQSFGSADSGHCTYRYDTIINNGVGTFTFTNLKLTRGNQGFTIDSADTSPLPFGKSHLIKLCFRPISAATVTDTLELTAQCGKIIGALTGNGGPTNFIVTDHDFDTVIVGSMVSGVASIINQSTLSFISIDSVWLESPGFFQILPNQAGHVAPPQFLIAPQASDTVQFQFVTSSLSALGPYETKWHALSRAIMGQGETGIRTGTLTAFVTAPQASVLHSELKAVTLSVSPNPARDELWVRIIGGSTTRAMLPVLRLYDILGRALAIQQTPMLSGDGVVLNLSSLEDGVYYLKAMTGDLNMMRRIVIQR
ncbi:MAG: T9SS type A sorting domain-containing protein [Bacteroidota bacterium]|nr:T9SS type A sorting domain-containing protein [Bacteroidota bacterium]MDP4288260.1 T9SS type A sorting domain-containing protein [Bacteroidota bacterium]